MAGKAPLLLASLLFLIGIAGLAFTSAERASWGPFEPRPQPQIAQRVVVVDMSTPFSVPELTGLLSEPAPAIAATETPLRAQAPASSPEPQATPTPLPPLKVFGISADDGGFSAAGATPPPLVPLRVGNVASDDETVDAPPPEVVVQDPNATPEPEASPQPESTTTPGP
jgi:hypothetical protein